MNFYENIVHFFENLVHFFENLVHFVFEKTKKGIKQTRATFLGNPVDRQTGKLVLLFILEAFKILNP